MAINADINLLKKTLDDELKKFKTRKDVDRRKTNFVVTYGAVISALTTVLIGLSSYLSDFALYFNVAALITSATVTIIQAWDKLFNHKRLWIMQAEVLYGYRELKEDISHLEAKESSVEQAEINACYERYKQIKRKFNADWMDLRNSE